MALLIIFLTGCATTGAVIESKNVPGQVRDKKSVQKIDSDAVIVRAKRMTRLETLKFEAVKKNNRQTVEVTAGTIGAIAAYIISGSTIRTGNRGWDQVASLGATAGAAYLTAGAAGYIYDFFAGIKP